MSFLAVLPAAFGWLGVAVFFVVSGFCIHFSHERSRYQGYKVFFLRRFFRIYPPYLLSLCLFVVLPLLTKVIFPNFSNHRASFQEAGLQFLPHIFLVHNFSEKLIYGVNGSFWSIAVEVQLYLLYPLLLRMAGSMGWQRVLWITALIEMGLRSLESCHVITSPTGDLPRWLTASPFSFWFSWSIGAALADAYLKGEALPFRHAFGFLWPLLLAVGYFYKPLFPFCFTLAALSTTCLMAYFLGRPSLDWTSRGWANDALEHLRWAGIVSYSAYLIHEPLLSQEPAMIALIFHHHIFSPLALFGFCLLSWFPIFGLSYVFYRLVERPSIAWGKSVIERSWAISAGPVLATAKAKIA